MATQELQRPAFRIDWDDYVAWYNTARCPCGHLAMDHGVSRGCWEFECTCERRFWTPWADMDLKSRAMRTLAVRGLTDDELHQVQEVERTKMSNFLTHSRINPEVPYVASQMPAVIEFVLKNKPRHGLEGGLPYHHAWDWNTKYLALDLASGHGTPALKVWR